MLKRNILFAYLLVAASSLVFSQSVLKVEDAIKIGLEKNYSVLMVKNEQEIAKLQNNFGNAGMSPTVSVNANLNLANINSYQEFSTGVIQERNGAQSNNTGASVNVGWMIFDGLKMFAVKKRLGLNEQLSAIELKQQMENTVYDIVSAYYTVVKTNELIKAAKQNLSIYEERKKIAKLKLEIGSDSKVDVLLSQSNENKAKSAIIQLELQLLNAKTKLNTLLNKPVDTEFNTTDSIVVNFNPNIDDLKKDVSKSNSSILKSKQNELITQQSIKEARSANLPFVQLNGAYNFTRAQSQAGFVFLNQQAGLNAGVTAGWLLFNGNKNSKLVKERNILYLNQKYSTEQMRQQIDGQVFNSYKTYLLNKTIVDLERQNLTDSKEVLDVSIERYKVGKSNLLETIETQKNLEDAQVRYIEALYAIKMAETDLLRVNGSLVK
ncbi:MAG: TolC family protein [Bacteroidetes bacterium]|nr:TolC family protein [Bacteroidota bacterium]